ncbi:MAG: hypothetical protein A2735_02775 [Candidatus Yanofskybacteria bacterium RIFCSPHIGHO2_01_FULL_41_21]|uniref:LysM domain-containing protein n=1 Tax=Candidatus Yanofskybacteria bacterium RIFCSPHIGHO2_01_FULL_41_21 TaxID=1802660 RepID=A0A1F8EAG8_9BACT|nr:MAG: hypothetical protein A2735_02775 [Candidatus Yanofskybacteria bacterium RIFCSPHIGHO2_01_FULL_41_21]
MTFGGQVWYLRCTFSQENFSVLRPFLAPDPIRTILTNKARKVQTAVRPFSCHLGRFLKSERNQLGIILGIALILIIIKGPGSNQSGIIGNVVRHYIEETSASIIPTDKNSQLTDIGSLMGGSTSIIYPANPSTIYEGRGGPGEDTPPETYTIQNSSIQSIDSASTDYLNDIKPNKIIEYTIQPGDALSFIASDYGVTVNDIIWANNLKDVDSIKPEQIIRIPPVSGVIYKIKSGDTVSLIAKKYGIDEEKIKSFNDISENGNLNINDEIIVPGGKMTTQPKTKVQTATSTFAHLPNLGDYFALPTKGRISQGLHGRNGVDIAASCGTSIFADADGTATTVDDTGYNGGFGKLIKLSHPNGTESLFGHANKLLITVGQVVIKGQLIAIMGSTGRSTGCHLHWEVHGAKHPLSGS